MFDDGEREEGFMTRHPRAAASTSLCVGTLSVLFLFALPAAAHASVAPALFKQAGKLVGQGAVGFPRCGNSVAISADGNTLLVGGPGDNQNLGAAWVYARTASGWSKQGVKLTPPTGGGGSFGYAVALSADGNTALIGTPGDGDAGSAWVFTRIKGVWYHQFKLTDSSGEPGECFGSSVALSAAGDTALVGCPEWSLGGVALGEALVFSRFFEEWTQQELFTGMTRNFGMAVALSADGNTALVGGPTGYGGSALVEVRAADGSWSTQALRLTPSDEVGEGAFGWSVALSADGNTALIGAPDDNDNAGAAWTFTRLGVNWSQRGYKVVASNETEVGCFGSAVALSSAASAAVIGGYVDDYHAGAAWAFSDSSGVWTPNGVKLSPGNEIGGGEFGTSVSISGNGRTALIGAPFDNGAVPDCSGAAWLYVSDATRPLARVKPASGLKGHTVLLQYRFSDPDDARVLGVVVRVKNARGKVLARFSAGSRKTGCWYTQKWVARVGRGAFRFLVSGRDAYGNKSNTAVGKITIK